MLPAAATAATLLVASIAASAAPALGQTALPADVVAVGFKEPVGDRFVGVLNTVMGTETVRRETATRYRFRIGPRGTRNDWAVFFAHLPYVREVSPAPQVAAADREPPDVLLGLGATRTASDASGTSGAGIWISPRQVLGTHLFVRYRGGEPVPALLNQVMGTRTLEATDAGEARIGLPSGVPVRVAARMFRLCPYVTQAEPAHGR